MGGGGGGGGGGVYKIFNKPFIECRNSLLCLLKMIVICNSNGFISYT